MYRLRRIEVHPYGTLVEGTLAVFVFGSQLHHQPKSIQRHRFTEIGIGAATHLIGQYKGRAMTTTTEFGPDITAIVTQREQTHVRLRRAKPGNLVELLAQL